MGPHDPPGVDPDMSPKTHTAITIVSALLVFCMILKNQAKEGGHDQPQNVHTKQAG